MIARELLGALNGLLFALRGRLDDVWVQPHWRGFFQGAVIGYALIMFPLVILQPPDIYAAIFGAVAAVTGGYAGAWLAVNRP